MALIIHNYFNRLALIALITYDYFNRSALMALIAKVTYPIIRYLSSITVLLEPTSSNNNILKRF